MRDLANEILEAQKVCKVGIVQITNGTIKVQYTAVELKQGRILI